MFMSSRPKILLVEDDDCSAKFVLNVLPSSEYEVMHAETGMAALNLVQQDLPDLVLLDVNMPGMSGYEVCQALRDDEDLGLLPVIFLSSLNSDEERLAGYEAGGDDYLTKSVSINELQSKIKLQLAIQAERSRLKTDLANACSTAMTAMSGAAEIGVALQFLRTSLACSTYAELCHEIFNTLGAYGLEGSIQIRGQQGMLSLNVKGPCSPLEESVLTNIARHGRLFEFSSRISCSYDHVTISVARDELDDHGRMKDNLAIIAEGANARILALDKCITLTKQHAMLSQLTAHTQQALQRIEWCQ
jgi:CheY-like chemotaxis protein